MSYHLRLYSRGVIIGAVNPSRMDRGASPNLRHLLEASANDAHSPPSRATLGGFAAVDRRLVLYFNSHPHHPGFIDSPSSSGGRYEARARDRVDDNDPFTDPMSTSRYVAL